MHASHGLAQSSTIGLQTAVQAGNVNIGVGAGVDIMDLSESSIEEQEKHAMLLKRVESERRARAIVVPTNKDQVRDQLRSFGQPVRLFGEHLVDIRERLRMLLANIELDGEELTAAGLSMPPPPPPPSTEQSVAAAVKKGDVYSEASSLLIETRKSIFDLSIQKANERLKNVKRRKHNDDEQKLHDEETLKSYESMSRLSVQASQLGDTRPLACIKCTVGGGLVATGSLSNTIKIWDADKELTHVTTLGNGTDGMGHTERTTGLAWHPLAQLPGGPTKPLLATAAADKTAKIWEVTTASDDGDGSGEASGEANSGSGRCMMTMVGHQQRLGMVGFHPSGEFIGTASSDRTWRLWHVETGKEILLQDGHVKEVHMLSFQHDGALVCSGDFAGVGNVWDLRCGRKIMSLTGHVKRIVCGDFSPNGFQIVTGGDDHTVRLWDLRMKKCSYTIPAHGNLVSSTRYDQSGECLLTCSFDGKIKIWGCRDWKLLSSLSGHDGKVMSADWQAGGGKGNKSGVISVGFDRTIKRWADDNA